MEHSCLKGAIFFKTTPQGQKRKLLEFEPSLKNPDSFDSLLISQFDFIKLDKNEKRALSKNLRLRLYHYMTFSLFEMKRYKKELIKKIEQQKSHYILIEADEFGAYICMAALYSGELPEDKEIDFHLTQSPFGLFPKELLISKNLHHNHRAYFESAPDSWLGPFESLCDTNIFHRRIKAA